MERISELHEEEVQELPEVMRQIETALSTHPDFNPDRFNYLQLGNGLHHLHFHGIPRYKTERNFLGKVWEDASWGMPPVWSKESVAVDVVEQVKEAILQRLK